VGGEGDSAQRCASLPPTFGRIGRLCAESSSPLPTVKRVTVSRMSVTRASLTHRYESACTSACTSLHRVPGRCTAAVLGMAGVPRDVQGGIYTGRHTRVHTPGGIHHLGYPTMEYTSPRVSHHGYTSPRV